MNRERDVWQAFNKALPQEVMRRRIEDSSGNWGTPDVWTGYKRWGAWWELKFTRTVGRRPHVRLGQLAFWTEAHAAMIPGAYIVGSGDGKVRIINGLTDGKDWKDHLIDQWDEMSPDHVIGLLRRFGLNGL